MLTKKPIWPRSNARLKSRQLVSLRRNLVPKSCFYGYDDLILGSANGVQVVDTKRNKFIDLTSSIHTTSLGYQHPIVIKAVKKQAETLTSFSLGLGEHQVRVELARKLHSILPPSMGHCQIAYCNSGSEAVEAAIRLVRESTKKINFVSYIGAYHGFTQGALSITTSSSVLRERLTPASTVFYAPYPYCYRCPYGLQYPECDIYCADKLAELFRTVTAASDTGALFAEPIQVHGGVIVPPDGYFQKISSLLSKVGVLLVVDEIVTALGRTGKMFGIEHWPGVVPDVICIGKPLASGLPLAAVAGRYSLTSKWSTGIPSGYAGNLLACAAAITTIRIIQKKKLVKRSAELGEASLSLLKEELANHPLVGDIRGKGLLIGIELVKPGTHNMRPNKHAATNVRRILFKMGYLIDLAGHDEHVLRLSPALTIDRDVLERSLMDVCSAVKMITR
jgi:4-aminobutyrate aminotransferase-like enzyme